MEVSDDEPNTEPAISLNTLEPTSRRMSAGSPGAGATAEPAAHRLPRTTCAQAAERCGLANILRAPEADIEMHQDSWTISYKGETDTMSHPAFISAFQEIRDTIFKLEDEVLDNLSLKEILEDRIDGIISQRDEALNGQAAAQKKSSRNGQAATPPGSNAKQND